ncbi:type II toxin-antitoxin system RelE/ParE family toxin [Agrococcus sediminis]|uniref:type II toxin-antitoxin system RelE family toxin n=1 Tax=Agrococcus TaxID=46352 RepID=UPI001FF41675|nr:type II toxin-antitoxin system RelE/ParE family toxin [Agrococcus sp. SCSIO52902]UOW01865.1 type II toxin-antitoxin system RelE/ParE family toxin [Agrococcus sp. SCSIO52902]
MTSYSVEFTTAAARELKKLEPRAARDKILEKVRALADDPRPPGCRKIAGEQHAWRIRVGDYRVLYEVDDRVVTVAVFRIAHRREVY